MGFATAEQFVSEGAESPYRTSCIHRLSSQDFPGRSRITYVAFGKVGQDVAEGEATGRDDFDEATNGQEAEAPVAVEGPRDLRFAPLGPLRPKNTLCTFAAANRKTAYGVPRSVHNH